MKKVLLSTLTLSLLALTACGGVATPTTPAQPTPPATSPDVPTPPSAALLRLDVDAGLLARAGLSVQLVGTDLVVTPTDYAVIRTSLHGSPDRYETGLMIFDAEHIGARAGLVLIARVDGIFRPVAWVR